MNNPKNLTTEQIQQAQQAQQAQQSNPVAEIGAEGGMAIADMGLGQLGGKDTSQPGKQIEAFNTGGDIEGSGFESAQVHEQDGLPVEAVSEGSEWVNGLLDGGGEVISGLAEGAAEVASDVIGGIVGGLLS